MRIFENYFCSLTEKLEEKLNNVQQKLFGFKSKSRDAYDNLIGQDDVLSREIKVMTTRVDAFEREALPRYTSQSKGSVPKPSGGGDNVTNRLIDSNRPEAVQRFQNFQAKISFQIELSDWLRSKVGCVFLMVIVPILPRAGIGPNDHENAPHFI